MLNLRNTILWGLVALGLSACGTTRGSTDPVTEIEPGERPELHTDEAGLWMQFEQSEEDMRNSGQVEIDRELNQYVKGVVCKLEPQYCDDIRVYVVNAAGFNAGMTPNGAMYVWTGLLLRVENEAQMATVLAHELAHFRQRHSLAQWRDLRAKTDGLVVLYALVGFPAILALGPLDSSLYSFSRDQEREADDLGFDSLTAAGYDPREAPKIWEFITDEEAASNVPRSPFKATHPPSDTRQEALVQKVAALGGLPDQLELGAARFLAETRRFRAEWLAQELKAADFGRGIALIDRLLERDPEAGDLHFAKGEMLRRRSEDGDLAQAVASYQTAMSGKDYPPEAHRSLALVKWTQGHKAEAVTAFENYLDRKPDADDNLIIQSYIRQLK